MSPTIIEDMYPILFRQKTSNTDTIAKAIVVVM
jgi:hypothetical protein